MARVGLLESTSASSSIGLREAFVAGLHELGYVVDKNIHMEYRYADGKYERLPALAAELVQLKMDIIVAGATPAIQAAQRATATIPIVMVRTADPLGSGFVGSLSRPARNITGLSTFNVEVAVKHLEFLVAVIPKLSRVTVLVNPTNPVHAAYFKRVHSTASANDVAISRAEASVDVDIDKAFRTIKENSEGALIVLGDAFFFAQARRIAALAVAQRLPTMFWTREPVESGGLMSYGQNLAEHFFRAATYVDKILKGAKPGDLPVEQPTKIELVINLKTAKALGIAIPQSILLRADKVIE